MPDVVVPLVPAVVPGSELCPELVSDPELPVVALAPVVAPALSPALSEPLEVSSPHPSASAAVPSRSAYHLIVRR